MTKKKSAPKRKKTTAKRKVAARSTSTRRKATKKTPASQRRKTASRKKTRPSSRRRNAGISTAQKAIWGGMFLVFIMAITLLSLWSPNQAKITASLSGLLWAGFGWGGLLVPIILGGFGLYMIFWGMGQPPTLSKKRIIGLALLFLTFEAFATILTIGNNNGLTTVWEVARAGQGGGWLGGLLTSLSMYFGGIFPAIFLWVIAGIFAAVLVSGFTLADLRMIWDELQLQLGQARTTAPADFPQPMQSPLFDNDEGDFYPASDEPPSEIEVNQGPIRDGSRRRPLKDEPAVVRSKRRPARKQKDAPVTSTTLTSSTSGKWQLPALAEMLDAGMDQNVDNMHIQRQTQVIEQTLASFGAPVNVVAINQGPTITQFGVKPQYIELRNGKRTKVKVGKIASLADDLALALSARSIRIQAPVPGKGYVGIEVPNTAKNMVVLRDILESDQFRKIRQPLRIGLGENVAGQPVSTSLAKMPHMLIAGATGSGKSVCVNSIIASLLLQYTPDDLRFVMVDPKRVELTGYNGIPHLVAPVVVDTEKVIGTLQWAMREMDTRYKMLAERGTRNIIEYNKKVRRSPSKKLPYIVIIIDELADLMMMAPEDTEKSITRLAQMARATGIHMILATQRPSVDVVTGLIKANFPARIAFAVSSSTDSRVILDTTGAERLLGQGDMLFQSPDAAAAVRLQGCFVDEEELGRLIDFWRAARRENMASQQEARAIEITNQPTETPIPSKPEPPSENGAIVKKDKPSPPDPQIASDLTAPSTQPKRAKPVREKATIPQAKKGRRISPEREATLLAQRERETKVKATAPPAKPKSKRKPKPPAKVEKEEEMPALVTESQPALWDDLIEEEVESEPQDEIFDDAVAMVRKLGKASTSLLQRRFRIGYTRSARIIDMMEEKGIIGPPTGTSKARTVIPWE